MSNDRELDDGLAAFDQLCRTMAETNRLLNRVQSSQSERNRQETALSAELQTALKQATGASQEALQASRAKLRSSLSWMGATALLTLLMAFGGGYWFGHRAGSEQGQAEGYQVARNEQSAASWGNTPSGQLAYQMDRAGLLQALGHCRIPGYEAKFDPKKKRSFCYPTSDASGWAVLP